MFLQLPPELNPDGERFIDRGLGMTVADPRHDGIRVAHVSATRSAMPRPSRAVARIRAT
jgi:hypothetical protein